VSGHGTAPGVFLELKCSTRNCRKDTHRLHLLGQHVCSGHSPKTNLFDVSSPCIISKIIFFLAYQTARPSCSRAPFPSNSTAPPLKPRRHHAISRSKISPTVDWLYRSFPVPTTPITDQIPHTLGADTADLHALRFPPPSTSLSPSHTTSSTPQ
jgi:hypothetical protein